jgi:hypothetical protein
MICIIRDNAMNMDSWILSFKIALMSHLNVRCRGFPFSSSFATFCSSMYSIWARRGQHEQCVATMQRKDINAMTPYIIYPSMGDGRRHNSVSKEPEDPNESI